MTDVMLPLTIKHFGGVAEGGAGEAYHSGVFGITGSGKSVFAAYLLVAQMRHPQLAIIVIDPQGQFTHQHGMPVPLHDYAEELGRPLITRSISHDLQLPKNAPLLIELLAQTRVFTDFLTIKGRANRESAMSEFEQIVRGIDDWESTSSDTLLAQILQTLADDNTALNLIYSSKSSQQRLRSVLSEMLNDASAFNEVLELFQPLHSLFTDHNQSGGTREPLEEVLEQILTFEADAAPRPLIILDFLPGQSADNDLLEQTPVKARILRVVCSLLNRKSEQMYKQGQSLNTLIVFDEAHRFAAQEPEDDESRELADRLVDYVRTTRKYGLGWMFITQEVGSLRRGVYVQLRLRAFGYGLTSGTERQRLREIIGDEAALDIYRSFVDPLASTPPAYSFMLTGPVSPLSFTGQPVFLSVFTSFEDFKAANAS